MKKRRSEGTARTTHPGSSPSDFTRSPSTKIPAGPRSGRLHLVSAPGRDARQLLTLGRIARQVAHDFNHVLAAIRLNADILAAGALGEFGPLQNITRAVAAGALLTKRISGLGTDRKAGNGSVCVNDAIYANNDLLISVLDDRFDLTFDLPDQSGWVGLSSSEMGCVLLNLVLNARNAMPEGGGIAIRVTRGRGKVVLRVSDEGAGFDRDRLRQLRSGVVPWAEDGRGIGFSIVAELVHSAGGLMTLRNHPGEGATVSISLPCLGKLRVLNLRKNTEPDIAFPATVN